MRPSTIPLAELLRRASTSHEATPSPRLPLSSLIGPLAIAFFGVLIIGGLVGGVLQVCR